MPFPEYTRVIYEHNPLIEVICQVRFPRILRIENDIPVDFQEAISDYYPILEERRSTTVEVNPDEERVDRKSKLVFEFMSRDKYWKAVLTSDFLALSTLQYSNWEEFESRFEFLVTKATEIYQPKYFTRIGLRYKDLIKRSRINMTDQAWSELINHSLAGILGSNEIDDTNILGASGDAIMQLSEVTGMVHMQYGLAQDESQEECYLIDSDFYTNESLEIGNASTTLRTFNKKAGQLFRWCITDALHNAMEPGAPSQPE